jgi:D-sedoheptulose 7-phosphate isomerase
MTLGTGGKVLLCGNGGSAADAQHIAAELVGRLRRPREGLAAIALTTDTSILTALGNDFGFEEVFARQIGALGKPGDVLVALSTSGKSPNILKAAAVAREREMYVVGLTGSRPTPLTEAVDVCVAVPAEDTMLVQQAHLAILHSICDLVDRAAAK